MGPYALPVEVYVAGLVFARVGAILMLLPGIGDAVVPPRMRLALALLLAFVLFPIAAPAVGSIPVASSGLAGAVIREVIIGLMIGGLLRLFLASLAVAGEVVSLQTTLAFAQTANPLQAMPGTTVAAFLTLLGITLIFATDLHHLFIAALGLSYQHFRPGELPATGDLAQLAIQTISGAFSIGLQISAPFLVFGLIFYVGLGVLSRLMPQLQIFFIAVPASIIFGFLILALVLGTMLSWFLGDVEASATRLLGR